MVGAHLVWNHHQDYSEIALHISDFSVSHMHMGLEYLPIYIYHEFKPNVGLYIGKKSIHPKNHGISKQVVWRSQTPAIHIQTPL